MAAGRTFLTFAATIFRYQMRVIFLSLPDEPLNAVATSAHLPAARCADVPTPPSVEDLADLTAKSGPVRYSKRTQSQSVVSFYDKIHISHNVGRR